MFNYYILQKYLLLLYRNTISPVKQIIQIEISVGKETKIICPNTRSVKGILKELAGVKHVFHQSQNNSTHSFLSLHVHLHILKIK